MQVTDRTTHWLLEGDPAIRWQTLRDLLEAGERTVERERNFEMERRGAPSRWNTLCALRVMKWWERPRPQDA
jgi:hypothetical protein